MSNPDDPSQGKPTDFHAQAERCRRLSRATYDRSTAEMLNRMAENYDRGEQPSNDR
jgi:hypothetical protein